MRWLKPRNGHLWCRECGEYSVDNPQFRWVIGKACPECLERKRVAEEWYRTNPDSLDRPDLHEVGTVEVYRPSVIGPFKPIVLTGNPLTDAASVLKKDGWVAGDFVCEEGKKCLDGALRAACGIHPDPQPDGPVDLTEYEDTKWYKRGERKHRRAALTLAEEIVQTDIWQKFLDRDGYWRENMSIATEDNSVEIITTYNDTVIRTHLSDSRKDALKILRKAAKKWNPRRKVA